MEEELKRGEISVVNEDQLVADIAADICDTVSRLNGLAYTPQQWMGTARSALKHFSYHATREPVSVSLTRAYSDEKLIALVENHDSTWANLKEIAKTVLDAAGVAYVD